MFGNFPNTISFFTPLRPSSTLLCSLEYNYLKTKTCFSKQYVMECILLSYNSHTIKFTIYTNSVVQWF